MRQAEACRLQLRGHAGAASCLVAPSPSPGGGVLGLRVGGHAGAVNTWLTGRGQITFAQDILPSCHSSSFPDNFAQKRWP